MSQRGQESCPQCKNVYFNRYKPEKCAKCSFHIGGSFKGANVKKAKLDLPQCVKLFTEGTATFYSSRTTRIHRCLFVQDGNSSQCLHEKCKLTRAAVLNSGKPELFTCEHIEKQNLSVPSLYSFRLTPESIQQYKAEDSVKETLMGLVDYVSFDHLFCLAESLFCIYGPPTSANPIGFTHVRIVNEKVECSSAECKGYVSVMRQEKSKKICVHCHVLFCLASVHSFLSSPTLETTVPSSTIADQNPLPSTSSSSSTTPADSSSDPTLSISRISTLTLNMQNSLPYVFPRDIFDIITQNDTSTWPTSFMPSEESCRLCNGQLSHARPHPGQKAGETSFLLTNAVPFLPVKILVKFCSTETCKAMHQVFPVEMGLFNISDKVLVSFDIMLELRELFKRGVPISVAIESKLSVLALKTKQVVPSLDYISSLLYNGYYCFEAITERNLDNQICGICGILGEVYLGDGNQKNCCTTSEISYNQEDMKLKDGHPLSLDDMLDKVKRHFIECNSYTRAVQPLSFHVSEIPPVVAPKLAGDVIWNSEMNKKSQFLKKQGKSLQGDPALLHSKIRDSELDMSQVQHCSITELRALATNVGIPCGNKSKQCLLGDIQQLYASLLVGDCPCHGFTKVPGHTGGFYHLVCRHGVTVISKCLALQESVRDAADLYLSLKYPPILFVCDTACGFVRHMDCRSPEVGRKLWGKYSGCFEVPDKQKLPLEDMNVPYIVPVEYIEQPSQITKSDGDDMVHPLSGEARRYVLGDRFHSANNPHKSPLCAYHDINLCVQANAVKTSYQESENNRKNIRRLRSACVQGFGVHFLYNYLMDFYQNEQIVNKQLSILRKNIPSGAEIVRDTFMRFVYVQAKAK